MKTISYIDVVQLRFAGASMKCCAALKVGTYRKQGGATGKSNANMKLSEGIKFGALSVTPEETKGHVEI